MTLEARMVTLEGLVRRLLTRVGESTDVVTSVFTRTGAVVAATNDYTWAQVDKTTSDVADLTTKNVEDMTFSDNTTNNASTSKHGFLKKLDNSATNFMNGQGNWAAPASSDTDTMILGISGGSIATSGAGATQYGSAMGYNGIDTVEAQRVAVMPVAGTAQKLYVRITTNGTTGGTSTCTLRNNSADTALVVTITAGTTGTFSDTSNTVAVAAADVLGTKWITGTGGTYVQAGAFFEYVVV